MLTVGINASPLAAPPSGVARYIRGLWGGLAAAAAPDLKLRGLFAPAALLAGEPVGTAASLEAGALRHLRAAVKRLPAAYALAQAARASLLAAARVTVYHETNHAAPPFAGPVVLTIHDLCTVRFPETQEPARARHFARALRERARRAARVVVPSAAIGREVVEHLAVDPARVRVAHHGVGARFHPAPPEPAALAPGYLLHVGDLGPRKEIAALLDAYDALPSALAAPLVLAGGAAPPSLRARLTRKRSGRVILLGFVAEAALPGLYRGAAALCLPSRYEGFGLPLLEAMACGVPCVASDDPALVEVADGAALHVPRGDAAALAAGLARILEDSALRASLCARGPARAAAFRWEASAAIHADAYREAARDA